MIPYLVQMLVIITVIITALVNLTFGYPHQELWISLLSSCIGYVVPGPKLKKKKVISPNGSTPPDLILPTLERSSMV